IKKIKKERTELKNRLRRLLAHVVDGVLVAQPVAALDRVVPVPAPVVLGHVAQRGVDAALRRHRVRAGGEELGDAGHLEALLGQTKGGAQASPSGAHHDGIVLPVHDVVRAARLALLLRVVAVVSQEAEKKKKKKPQNKDRTTRRRTVEGEG